MTDSILNKALQFLGEPTVETPSTHVETVRVSEEKSLLQATKEYELIDDESVDPPKKKPLQATKKYELIDEEDETPLLRANLELEEAFPNLIFRDADLGRVADWLETVDGVALDTETYGYSRRKEDRKKEALSFVVGKIRLVQLSAGGTSFILDAALLSNDAVAGVLEMLRDRPIYLHNAIFDLPRVLKAFGINLIDEDVRDTMILSRILRAGQWELKTKEDGSVYSSDKRHNIQDVLFRELGVKINKETDHRWERPLTEGNIRYASEDVEHLEPLYHDLLAKVENGGLLPAYSTIKKVYPVYMRQQARGVPFDAGLYTEMYNKLEEALEVLETRLREHAPEHPDEDGEWVWRNYNKPENKSGRNGILRALALAGTPLPNTQKNTRLVYIRKYEGPPFLTALDQYLKYADLAGNTRGWLDLYYEGGRLYPNVQFFSQVTGRSAYQGPPLQNFMKDIDLPGMEKKSFRDCIRAPEGHQIVKADYSAQELRILAHVTGDERLIGAFLAQAEGGKDPHLLVGEQIAGRDLRRGPPEDEAYRQGGKRVNYGFSYGAGWKTYRDGVYKDTAELISEKQAKQEKWAFEEAWPEVHTWQQSFGDRAGHEPEAWYTTSFLGRRRYVGRNKDGRPNYCDRLNGPIQQGGADQLYMALSKMLDDPIEGVHVIITTHDEIVLECPREIADEAAGWLLGHMREAIRETIGDELATEDCAEVEIGSSWGS
jgi:DNA polymerase I